MAGKKKRGVWEDEFEDISSDSHRPRPPRPPDYQIPLWEGGSAERGRPRRTSPERPRQPERGGENRPRRPQPQRRPKKPLSAGARRFMITVTVLIMAAVTVLLAVFLLFKITDIQITGDPIQGCANEEILSICGYKTGDNLFFIPTRSKERQLEERLPYVEEAKISRHLPGTVEIHLTGAAVASCVFRGDSWLYLSVGGKVLEVEEKPADGVMQVSGLDLPELRAGQVISIPEPKPPDEKKTADSSSASSPPSSKPEETQEEKAYQKEMQAYNAYRAYQTIAAKLADSGTSGDFTRLDLSDLMDIRLTYRGRIQFQLGSAAELEYKIDLGLRSVTKMEEEDPGAEIRGIMNLAYADESNKAFFTAGEFQEESLGGSASKQPEGAASQPAPSPTPTPTPGPRDEGIPDGLYTGEGSEAGGDGSTGDGWTDDGDGSTDDGWTDGGDGYTDDGWTDDGDGSTDDWTDDGTGYTDDGTGVEDGYADDGNET